MRAVIQRVLDARVEVAKETIGKIERGFVVFLGVRKTDTETDAMKLAKKICGLRIFEDENEKMNLSPKAVGAGLLVISNFTLYGNASHGFRPDFLESMPPQGAEKLYKKFIDFCGAENTFSIIQHGKFRADMKVTVANDGPVTLIIDTENLK